MHIKILNPEENAIMVQCPFCDPKAISHAIFENDDFLVFPTKGQIVEGYVLLVPKRHASCLGELADAEVEKFVRLKNRIADAMAVVYGQQPIFFEHGVVGQTVHHAHLHAAPVDLDLLPRIAEDFPIYSQIPDFSLLRDAFRRDGKYLYWENAGGEKFIFRTPWPLKVPPQYLRIVFAHAAGVPGLANWREMDPMLDNELIRKTAEKLRPAFFSEEEKAKI